MITILVWTSPLKGSREPDHNKRHQHKKELQVRKNPLNKKQYREENRKKSRNETIHLAPDAMMKKMRYLRDP